jgi:prephenate dehydrogenase
MFRLAFEGQAILKISKAEHDAFMTTSRVIRHINAFTALKIMKAEAHLYDAALSVAWRTNAEGRVHLASPAFGTPCQSELD